MEATDRRLFTRHNKSGETQMNCLFCDLAVGPNLRRNPEDQFLAESPSFYVKPALGHFATGYVLINSRRHVPSAAFLTEHELVELELVKGVVAQRLEQIYHHKVIVFEHGEVNEDHHPGCCFEHAHLHVVPLPEVIDDALDLDFHKVEVAKLVELTKLADDNTSYLLYEMRNGCRHAFEVPSNLPSQFMRRKVCQKLGMDYEWDWAVSPFRDRINEFLGSYRSYAISNGWSYEIAGLCKS